MKNYKKVLISLVLVLVGGFFLFKVGSGFVHTISRETQELSSNKIGFNPFGDNTLQRNLEDEDYQEYIHKMAHQKIKANQKWGFYRVTEERVEWLHEAIQEPHYSVKHAEVYEEILDRWIEGDFSQADEDHNAVWELQGGTVGIAYGLLSEEEEEEFLENANKRW